MTETHSSYADWCPTLQQVMLYLAAEIKKYSEACRKRTGEPAYEHLIYRIKARTA
jgi:putative GTP pyrophosphokinase